MDPITTTTSAITVIDLITVLQPIKQILIILVALQTIALFTMIKGVINSWFQS